MKGTVFPSSKSSTVDWTFSTGSRTCRATRFKFAESVMVSLDSTILVVALPPVEKTGRLPFGWPVANLHLLGEF